MPCDDVDPNARVERTVPTLIEGIKGRKAKAIAAGYSHNIAIGKAISYMFGEALQVEKLGLVQLHKNLKRMYGIQYHYLTRRPKSQVSLMGIRILLLCV